jgi:hypothetical protein
VGGGSGTADGVQPAVSAVVNGPDVRKSSVRDGELCNLAEDANGQARAAATDTGTGTGTAGSEDVRQRATERAR